MSALVSRCGDYFNPHALRDRWTHLKIILPVDVMITVAINIVVAVLGYYLIVLPVQQLNPDRKDTIGDAASWRGIDEKEIHYRGNKNARPAVAQAFLWSSSQIGRSAKSIPRRVKSAEGRMEAAD